MTQFNDAKRRKFDIHIVKGDFTNKPIRAPVKARCAFQFANHAFNDFCTEGALVSSHWIAHSPPRKG